METRVPPPLIVLIMGALMWVVASFVPIFAITMPGQFILIAVLLAAGLTIDLIAISEFFRKKTTVNPTKPHQTSQLVTTGLYRFSRNPMYVGQLFLLIAWAFWMSNAINIVLVASFVWYINTFQIEPEERALQDKFGESYSDYRNRVRRWL